MIKILTVDDEPGICDILKKTFSPSGFTVLSANNGWDALEVFNKEKPAIVLLDIHMLGMSGFQVLERVKKTLPETKVIMLTVQDDPQAHRRAREAGADEFLAKPFLSEELESLVNKQIAKIINKE